METKIYQAFVKLIDKSVKEYPVGSISLTGAWVILIGDLNKEGLLHQVIEVKWVTCNNKDL